MNEYNYKLSDKTFRLIIKYKKSKRRYFKIRMKIDNSIEVSTNYNYDIEFINDVLNKNKNWIINSYKKHQKYIKYYEEQNIHIDELFNNEKYLYLGKEYNIINNFNYKKFFKEKEDVLYEMYVEKVENLSNPPSVKFKFLKGRWGSYNKIKHEITLNYYLLFFDEEIINYVIDHEITHILVFNHQKEFYSELSKRCPNYLKIKERLKMMTLVSEILVAYEN